jgi:hypothetical protein
MIPSATLSCTAFATANCAGPNIWTACLAPLIVTLLNNSVLGLHCRLGAITARRDVNPSLLLVSALQNAVSTGLPRGPINRSTCATSLPSPTRDSPTITFDILAMPIFLQKILKSKTPQPSGRSMDDYPCWQRPDCPDRLAR